MAAHVVFHLRLALAVGHALLHDLPDLDRYALHRVYGERGVGRQEPGVHRQQVLRRKLARLSYRGEAGVHVEVRQRHRRVR